MTAPAPFPGTYPTTRLRRTRQAAWSRRLVAEHRLAASDLIWPIFVVDGTDRRETIPTMPGVERLSIDLAEAAVDDALRLGIVAVAVFPYVQPERRTPDAREALNPDNLVCRAVRRLKAAFPDVGVICDVALDPFSSFGHDGVVRDGKVINDETVDLLCRQAVVQAAAGCDVVAPSDMMDGRIGAIRAALDGAGFSDLLILSYAAKFASALYAPFRDAIGSGTFLKGDKRSYQMDPANADEAMREVAQDIAEGADMLLVKPGVPYLDVLARVAETFRIPTFAYHVSGEYAMLRAAERAGVIDYPAVLLETLLAFKRAGARGVLTYAAIDAARFLLEER
jgi:Delta-aminolevulinic acid dehydratase